MSTNPALPPINEPAARVSSDVAALVPFEKVRSRWPAIIGALLTLAMIAGLARQLLGSGLEGLSRSVPRNPLFYVCFSALYMSLPTGDFIIFRHLWRIPGSGLIALIKKRIANEVVFGYSGEAYFYSWARARSKMIAAPFGAVKDVSILSAVAGNAITLAMIAAALPFAYQLLTHDQLKTLGGSAAIIMALSLPFLIFSKRVFSLGRRELWWIFIAHCLRLLAGSTLIALAWHFAMPMVGVAMWLFLAAGRLLVSRLPLVPNKDLLFANFAILFIGKDRELSDLIAFTAALTLVVHVVLIITFGMAALTTRKNAWR